MQLPEFVQQYSQRLSGHLNEALQHLQQFQFIADSQSQGSLTELIQRYLSNSDPVIVQTGQLINTLTARIAELDSSVNFLQQSNYWQRLYYFFSEFEPAIVQATAQQFVMAIPLEPNALLTGVLIAFTAISTKAISKFLLYKLYLRLQGFKSDKPPLI